jgi:hypothetical protein
VTNDLDLFGVWKNLMRAPAAQDLNYDLNGDALVDAADLALVMGNYLASLPPPPVAPGPVSMLAVAVAPAAWVQANPSSDASIKPAAASLIGVTDVAVTPAHKSGAWLDSRVRSRTMEMFGGGSVAFSHVGARGTIWSGSHGKLNVNNPEPWLSPWER